MSLTKIISTASRAIRENEQNGVDYYFMSKEEILSKKENNELLQFVDFNDSLYGYEYSEFNNVDHLIIVCGGSGTGKDTIFNSFLKEEKSRFDAKNYKFLFSVPATLPIFIDYATDQNIKTTVIYLEVNEAERMKRIITGTIKENLSLVEKYNLDSLMWFPHINETDNKLSCHLVLIGNGSEDMNSDPVILQIVSDARNRVLRDRQNPFDVGIDIQKHNGYQIEELDLSHSDLSEAMDKVSFLIMDDIPLKTQENKFKPELGDVMPFTDNNVLCPIPEIDRNKYLTNVFSLGSGNPFDALQSVHIDTSKLEQKYTCPHSGLEFYSLIPLCLISTDLELYMKRSSNDMAFDKEWMWDREDPDDMFSPSLLMKSMIGSGYTYGCNFNDGFGEHLLVAVELENGDHLICLTWEWFNK